MKRFLEKLHLPNWIVGILALVLILRIPSFFEPYYYGDEMVYLTLGQGVRQGVTLYKDLHDNKPPLLYLTAAAAGSLFWFKVILAFWMLATTVAFYKLSKKLFENNVKAQKISTIIFALLTTLPLLEGNTVNAELFMIGPSIIAFLWLLGDKLSYKKLFFSGFLFGIGTLFKVPAAFDLPVIVVFWVIVKGFGQWKKIFMDSLVLAAGFIFPIALTIVYYVMVGAGPEYIKAAFLQNIGYLSTFRPQDVQKPFLVRNAPLLIRAFVVALGAAILWIFRKKLSRKYIFLTIWVLFTLFAVTLSERPYPHYLIQSAAPIALMITIFFAEKSFEQSLVVIPLALTFFVPVYYKFYIYPTSTYYTRFINFAAGRITKQAYFSSFSKSTNRNYAIANFLVNSSTTNDRVFMWDQDSAAVYSLARRLPPEKYVVPYHVFDFSSTEAVAKLIEENPPRFIILTSGNPYPELMPFVKSRYLLISQIEDASIWVRVNLAK